MPLRWPWVSRVRYDDLKCQYAAVVRADNASWWSVREELSKERDQYTALLDKYHELATGIPEQARKPVVMPEREPSLVSSVIREQAGGDHRLSAHLQSYASKLKREGKSSEEIAQSLTDWTSTEVVEY